VANGTNRIAIIIQNIFAVSGFKSKGVSSFPYSIYLAISATFGAILGALWAVDIKGELFNKILAVIMVIIVIYMVKTGLFHPVSPLQQQEVHLTPVRLVTRKVVARQTVMRRSMTNGM